MLENDLRREISVRLQSPSLNSEAGKKRLHNILWLFDMPKEGLAFQEKVEQVLVHTTSVGEQIFIQYPGKESVREGDKCRPHDFFPRVLVNDGYVSDMSFWAIWRLLFEQLEPRADALEDEMRVLATLFYRMAFMIDHQPCSFRGMVRTIAYDDNQEHIYVTPGKDLGSLFVYQPPQVAVDYLSGKIDCGDMSLEAFLHYNNLLAWNEDCKYYYRAQLKGKPWMNATGRVNNLLTHISVLGFLLGDLKTFDVFYKFSAGAGVAPATTAEIRQITNNVVFKE